MSEAPAFPPTVTDHTDEGTHLVLHTADHREETDLIVEDGYELARAGDLLSEEQQEIVRLWNDN